MKKILQLGILLVCLFMALPLQAQKNEHSIAIKEALERFTKDKQVEIVTDTYIVEDSAKVIGFTCTWEPLDNFFQEFMKHFNDASVHFSFTQATKENLNMAVRATTRPNGKGTDVSFWPNDQMNVYILSFKETDGLEYVFCLEWDDMANGEKPGAMYQLIGYDVKLVMPIKGDDLITMDSVRTAIKVGETVKNNPQQEIDTTYIDGKWAVSAKYHRDVLRAMDHISDYQDGFPAIANKINELVELSKTASEAELASIGFALKREASRYERLLTPEEFALIWKGLLEMQTYAKNAISDTRAGRYPRKADPRILEYIKVSESILKSKANMSVRLQYHDTKRHQFLRDIGFTVTKNDGGRWYFAVSGKHYTGNPELEYLDACADEDGVLQYHAEHKETNLWPGIYRLTAAGRTSYQGNTGAFIFAKAEELLLKEIPACDDRGGDIWRDAAIRVKEADEKHEQISPNDVRIALANGGMGYGWSKIVIGDIIVRDGTLTYGVTCDQDFTGTQFKGRWLSAVDFVLERVGDLPKE